MKTRKNRLATALALGACVLLCGFASAAPSRTSAVVYHGYCRCSCSRVPDCNTNADCGGARCLSGISCC